MHQSYNSVRKDYFFLSQMPLKRPFSLWRRASPVGVFVVNVF